MLRTLRRGGAKVRGRKNAERGDGETGGREAAGMRALRHKNTAMRGRADIGTRGAGRGDVETVPSFAKKSFTTANFKVKMAQLYSLGPPRSRCLLWPPPACSDRRLFVQIAACLFRSQSACSDRRREALLLARKEAA